MLDIPAVLAEMDTSVTPDSGIAPQRAACLRTALAAAGGRVVPATPHHNAERLVEEIHDRAPGACMAAPGGTGQATRASVDATLTAVDLILAGAPRAYAICGLPGLHSARRATEATAATAGTAAAPGTAVTAVNNAALAAVALRAAGVQRVAIIDIDAHHGSGTQQIFYDRADVFYGSVHIGTEPPEGDGANGTDPRRTGRGTGAPGGATDRRGAAAGTGATRNVPLPAGIGDPGWLAAVAWLRAEAAVFGADVVVLSLGTDAAGAEPGGPFAVSTVGFATAGALLRDLRLPVLAVPEHGRVDITLGPVTVAVLRGLAGRTRYAGYPATAGAPPAVPDPAARATAAATVASAPADPGGAGAQGVRHRR